ncbi:SEP2 [Symbiodinium necroappetens]|uniref:SEP2 protein n=1 Tax=Symbiodinium necroappetens TaxID=1628268 RepID=A0A813BI97_9DINO|nr:SEP2 [Symbiodinium necroappetens]
MGRIKLLEFMPWILAIGQALELQNENFDDAIAAAGKNALVLFCSDFCPWCKNKLNATWTELMADWQGSDKVLVAHIDCGQPAYDLGGLSSPGSVPSVCKKHEIDPVCDKKTGHIPTIKYFDRQQSKWFRYKRDWEADVLEAFIHERLVPKCIVRTHEHCEDKDLAYLDKHTGKSRVSLQAEQKRLEGMKSQGKFTREQLKWLNRRINMIMQLSSQGVAEEEKVEL